MEVDSMTRKTWLMLAMLGLTIAFGTGLARAADGGCLCDGVCYTCDGCLTLPKDQIFNCCDGLQKTADDMCNSGGWCDRNGNCVAED